MSRKAKKQIFIQGSVAAGFANLDSLVAAAGQEAGLPTFAMLAYTGIPMEVGFDQPTVIDLAGLNLGNKNRPILLDHSVEKIVGHSVEAVKTESELRISGLISAGTEYSKMVVESAKNDFPWQASVGVGVNKIKMVREGETVEVNGQSFDGPIYVVTEGKLNEVSFVVLGADDNTESMVSAALDTGEDEMAEEIVNEEVVEEPVDAAVTDEEDEVVAEDKPTDEEEVVAEDKPTDEGETKMAKELDAKLDASVKALRAEQTRIQEIGKVAAKYPEVLASAIKDGLSVAETKAAIFDVEAARQDTSNVSAAFINVGAGKAEGSKVLEAALCMQAGLKNTEKSYDEKTLEAADKQKNVPLRRIMEMCAAAEGKTVEAGASVGSLVNAAYSTVSLPVILGNVANKSLLEGFMMAPSTAVRVAMKLTTQNFHTHTGVKLGGTGLMEAVNGGEVKSGTMSEESFTFKTNTVAKIIGLSRQDIVNDDLGAFTRLAANLGQSAFKTRENDFWALVLANTDSFFHADNSNLITTALSIDAIAEAEATLAAQTGIDGTPANVIGKYLVVPSQLGATARAIYTGTKTIGADALAPDANVFGGVYEPIVTPYLANATVNANASETGFYLWSDTTAPFGISYLNGNEAPTVGEVAPQAEFLGRAWRAYFDYGVCQIDYRGAVMSTGLGS